MREAVVGSASSTISRWKLSLTQKGQDSKQKSDRGITSQISCRSITLSMHCPPLRRRRRRRRRILPRFCSITILLVLEFFKGDMHLFHHQQGNSFEISVLAVNSMLRMATQKPEAIAPQSGVPDSQCRPATPPSFQPRGIAYRCTDNVNLHGGITREFASIKVCLLVTLEVGE